MFSHSSALRFRRFGFVLSQLVDTGAILAILAYLACTDQFLVVFKGHVPEQPQNQASKRHCSQGSLCFLTVQLCAAMQRYAFQVHNWFVNWPTESYDAADWEKPSNCTNPIDPQSRQLTCVAREHYVPRINVTNAIAAMQSITYVGLVEAYQESLCLFAVGSLADSQCAHEINPCEMLKP